VIDPDRRMTHAEWKQRVDQALGAIECPPRASMSMRGYIANRVMRLAWYLVPEGMFGPDIGPLSNALIYKNGSPDDAEGVRIILPSGKAYDVWITEAETT